MIEKEIETILEKAIDAAVDIVVAEMDCHPSDRDYVDRRRYARERLAEYLAREVSL